MTAEDYITAAMGRSYLNRGEVLADAVTELLGQLSRQFRAYYAQAAGLDSTVFAQLGILGYVSSPGSWTIPTDCDTVHAIEQNVDVPVWVVPYDDRRSAEPSEACVYRIGNSLYAVGNASDPTQTALTILYTPVPGDFTALSDVPLATWNENFDGMVVADLAHFLAAKDNRVEEMAGLDMELNAQPSGWRPLYAEWLGRKTVPTIRRFGIPRAVPTGAIVSAGVKKN